MGCLIADRKFRWPQGVVPFEIDTDDFPLDSAALARLDEAIDEWNNRTVIRLVQYNSDQHDSYVRFVKHPTAGNSKVGYRQERGQLIRCKLPVASDAPGDKAAGLVMHEIGHAVGLYHEHQRRDRDEFVAVDTSHAEYVRRPDNYDLEAGAIAVGGYDYRSITHYSKGAIAVVPGHGATDNDIGQRDHLSVGDLSTVWCMYNDHLASNARLEGADSNVLGCLSSDGACLYWFDRRISGIKRAQMRADGSILDSATVSANEDAIDPQHGIAFWRGWLYFWDRREGRRHLSRVSISREGVVTGSTEPLEEPPTSIDPGKGIAIGNDRLYYWDVRHGSVCSRGIDGNGRMTGGGPLNLGITDVEGCLAFGKSDLYWWDSRPGFQSIRRVAINKDGTVHGSSTQIEAPPSSVDPKKGFVISGDTFYWWDTRSSQLVSGHLRGPL